MLFIFEYLKAQKYIKIDDFGVNVTLKLGNLSNLSIAYLISTFILIFNINYVQLDSI